MNDSAHTLSAEVFRADQIIFPADFSKHLFGGLFSFIQTAQIPSFLFALVPVIFLTLLILYSRTSSKWILYFSIFVACSISALLSVRASLGYDEFFLNLRHSLLLTQGHGFSANPMEKVEATVDFIPFFSVGVLGKFGLPLPELGISLSFLGSVLCILAAFAISSRISERKDFALLTVFLTALFPGIIGNGATGFMANLFSALILWSIHDLCFAKEERELRGITILVSLCLFRIEGVLFSSLLCAWIYFIAPFFDSKGPDHLFKKKPYQVAASVLGVFCLSAIVRYFYFGFATPVPVVYKSTVGSLFFWKMGFRYGAKIFIEYKVQLVFAILLGSGWLGWRRSKVIRSVVAISLPLLFIFSIFELPYHFGGGDWFPIIWARYELPMLLFLYLVCWNLSFLLIRSYRERGALPIFLFCVVILSPIFFDLLMLPPVTALSKEKKGVYANLLQQVLQARNGWERIDRLSSFGKFIGASFPEQSLMASSEMATIFYFSGAEMLDLLGLVNRELATSPLNPFTDVDPTTRRRMPQLVDKYRPTILAYPAMSEFLLAPAKTKEDQVNALRTTIYRDELTPLLHFVGGGYEHKEKIGYHHFSVFFANIVFDYWVNESAVDEHRKRLVALGLAPSDPILIPYNLSKHELEKWVD